MNQEELIVLSTQTQHAKAKDEEECSGCNQGAMSIFVEQCTCKARQTEGEECLRAEMESAARQLPQICNTHDVIHDI